MSEKKSEKTIPKTLVSINEISTAWLQAVFDYAGVDVPAIVDSKIEPIGHGNSSHTCKVSLAYENHATDAPGSVICKFSLAEGKGAELVKKSGIYLCEAKTLNFLSKDSAARIPKCYLASVSSDTSNFNLVAEDLSVFCRPGDQISGCSIADAKAVVTELSRFHRQFWNAPILDKIDWVIPTFDTYKYGLIVLRHRFTGRLSEEEFDFIERAISEIDRWLNDIPINRTLLHTDCRADNIMFDYRDANHPAAYLIDWAMVRIGDAMSDVAYFLTSSLSPQDRLACEMDMLALHTQEIAAQDPTYTLEIAEQSYRKNIMSSMYLTLLSATGIPQAPHSDLLLNALAQRNCAAIKHWLD
jgi:hypothetical protein